MAKRTATAFFGIQLAADQAAPKEIMLFPAGPEVQARDGRKWTLNHPEKVLAAFTANGGPIAIDYEHAQAHKAPEGDEAPAAGWITSMIFRPGEGIFGNVEWTDRASSMIAAKEYRFISPEFFTDKNNDVLEIVGAGLVNRPAINMPALARADHTENNDMLKAIAKALGLDEGADEAAILAAISTRDTEAKAVLAATKVEKLADVPAEIQKLGEEKTRVLASQDDKEKELKALRSQVDDLSAKDKKREIASVIDKAVAEGKVAPASRSQFEKMCEAEGGIERFKELAATLPVILTPSKLAGDPQPKETGKLPTENPVELAARATAYKDEQAKLGRSISTMEAIEELKEKGE